MAMKERYSLIYQAQVQLSFQYFYIFVDKISFEFIKNYFTEQRKPMHFQTTLNNATIKDFSSQEYVMTEDKAGQIIDYFNSYNANQNIQYCVKKKAKGVNSRRNQNQKDPANISSFSINNKSQHKFSSKNAKRVDLLLEQCTKIDGWEVQKVLTEKCTNTTNIINYASNNTKSGEKTINIANKQTQMSNQSTKTSKSFKEFDSIESCKNKKLNFKNRKYIKSAKFPQRIDSNIQYVSANRQIIQNKERAKDQIIIQSQKFNRKKCSSLNQIGTYAYWKCFNNKTPNGSTYFDNNISNFQILKKEKQHLQTESIGCKFPTSKMISSQLNLLEQHIQQNGNKINFKKIKEEYDSNKKQSAKKKVSRIGIRRAKSIVSQIPEKTKDSKLFLQGLSKQKVIKKQVLQIRPQSGINQQFSENRNFDANIKEFANLNPNSHIFVSISKMLAQKFNKYQQKTLQQTSISFQHERLDENFAIHTNKTKLPFKKIFQQKRNKKLSLSNTFKQDSNYRKNGDKFEICQLKGSKIQKMLSTLERSNLQSILKNSSNVMNRQKNSQSFSPIRIS